MLFVAVAVLLAVSTATFARSTVVPARRGFLLGLSAGILYGLTAGLIKMATSHPGPGLVPLLGHWPVWLVPISGLSAFFTSQRAYQATRLSVSAPVLNIVDVLVAVTFGTVVFGDRLFTTPGRWVGELLGVTLMAVGVWRLVREDERLHTLKLRTGGARDPEPDATSPTRRTAP